MDSEKLEEGRQAFERGEDLDSERAQKDPWYGYGWSLGSLEAGDPG